MALLPVTLPRMIELDAVKWAVLLCCGLMIGFTKTGVPGLGILAVIILANVISPRLSTGLILPVLIVGDIFAVAYYRRHAVWKHLVKLLPWAILGIIPGYLLLDKLTDAQFKPVIGGIALVLIVMRHIQARISDKTPKFMESAWFAAIVGVLAGIVTMMANAAGPIMTVYLLAMRLPKNEFIGTGAWYFLILNCIKVPFSSDLGLINPMTLQINLAMFPLVVIGALAGIAVQKRIKQEHFNLVAEILAAAAAVKLLI
ncbi:MAG: hypothetical protein C0404_04925 [Verrucomicrobia bacterium]|nr:hypothetical protein [Verrucomicrobiota bacterium]